jgi:hypothetical protein
MSQMQLTTNRFFIGDTTVMDDGQLLILNKFEGTVKFLLHRALKQLQAILDMPQTGSGKNLKGEAL